MNILISSNLPVVIERVNRRIFDYPDLDPIRISNDSPYAGWIEYGGERTYPRKNKQKKSMLGEFPLERGGRVIRREYETVVIQRPYSMIGGSVRPIVNFAFFWYYSHQPRTKEQHIENWKRVGRLAFDKIVQRTPRSSSKEDSQDTEHLSNRWRMG